jgi:hypothetical protein
MGLPPTIGLRRSPNPGVGREAPRRSLVLIGARSGAASALVFTVVHGLTISNIWPMLGMMLVAGAVCGACLAWSYEHLFPHPSITTWMAYNAAHLAMFAVLAAVSVVAFEPVTTMAAITARGGPVDDLIVKALPLSGAFVVAFTGVLGNLWARGSPDYLRLLVTIAVLMLLVGLNVSVLGLVDFGGASMGPVFAFFGLIVLLDGVFAAGVLTRLRTQPSPGVDLGVSART